MIKNSVERGFHLQLRDGVPEPRRRPRVLPVRQRLAQRPPPPGRARHDLAVKMRSINKEVFKNEMNL